MRPLTTASEYLHLYLGLLKDPVQVEPIFLILFVYVKSNSLFQV